MKFVLIEFDKFLSLRNLKFQATVIGGAALSVMDVTDRVTKDVDLIDPKIPNEIKKASVDFIKNNPRFELNPDNWFNNGPDGLVHDLPNGWRVGLVKIFEGKSLSLLTLGRIDLLKTKLYAYCSRETDFDDCIALKPTEEELKQCKQWVIEGDGNPLWPQVVDDYFSRIRERLKYE